MIKAAVIDMIYFARSKFLRDLVHKKSQKQPSRGVLRKRCSEDMQRIYRRTPMPKCDFNEIALQFY